ncbi:DNA-processing protein DprA [Pullulanibacillus sp. KACC 23026]|uniref:DNA-processing protein DprA n=1 Tax=Pullulanibacillus sp. KACC 23026 TaxID=3028315 RepID=UPI0023B09D58|nr:DNA-processing protein DprA [Pullulanibacillus sp. KACC 23026]WEG11598.1 DNA-processing protein DprA [Pullulanibacillus sp. KACC 23026]
MDYKAWLFRCSHCRGLGRRSIRRLMSYLIEENVELTSLSIYELQSWLRVPEKKIELFLKDWCRFDEKKALESYSQQAVGFITSEDPEFPPLLKTIPDPPLFLYYMGHLEISHFPQSLSVVGTRTPTSEGLEVMTRLLRPLVERGWTLVSGLATGVDGHAHKLGLASQTIAVLGSGFYHVYPRVHQVLFKTIARDHLALSEYPPSIPPQRWQFPERNRLISGLTPATLVVEAKEKSGSLITADQALEQGRDVLAVPGSLLNENANGTNGLIKQGASLVASYQDLLDINLLK